MTAKRWCYFLGGLFSVPLWIGILPELNAAVSKFAVTSDNPVIFGCNILAVLITVYIGDVY